MRRAIAPFTPLTISPTTSPTTSLTISPTKAAAASIAAGDTIVQASGLDLDDIIKIIVFVALGLSAVLGVLRKW